jgi:undecaprenyl-phosphate 4-deoxy-4-formamido-L-arabinose transferase
VRGLLRHAANMVLGYSVMPLRLVTYLGLVVGAVGAALFVRVLWLYFTGETSVAGFTTTAAMVAMFAAAQMVALGVLGEYIGRLHSGGMGRPTYVIRQRVAASWPVSGSDQAFERVPVPGRHARR